MQRPSNPDITERIRTLCMALPGVTEKLSHGEATWWAGARQFVCMRDHHHDDRLALVCAAPPGVQHELVELEPTRFYPPPYVGSRGWLGVYLDIADVDWDEVAAIIGDAYRVIAPPKLLAQLDA
jgi:hypothetical protein